MSAQNDPFYCRDFQLQGYAHELQRLWPAHPSCQILSRGEIDQIGDDNSLLKVGNVHVRYKLSRLVGFEDVLLLRV
ncbi:hypothetical protein HG531_010686 [Fusarium graminearum]|nr:hypothetical protein HG531_010686 [Fusarium graminearum]